jgi:nucleoside phosphorylase
MFEELHSRYADFFEKRLFHLLNHEQKSNEWKSKLKKIVFHLVKLKEDFLSPSEFRYQYDAAFVTALYKLEFEAVLQLSSSWNKITHNEDPTIYYETTVEEDGKSKRIIAAFADQIGVVASTALCMKLIIKFKPKYIFLTGITAGLRNNKINYGDILVADLCWDYNSGKITEFKVINQKEEQKFSDMKFEPEPKSLPMKASIKNKLIEFSNDKLLLFQIKNEWKGETIANDLSAFVGPLASGSQ